MKTFEVKYTYYQYNTGRADNGTYTKSVFRNSEFEARQVAADIEWAILYKEIGTANLIDKLETKMKELVEEFLPAPGFFISVQIYEVEKKRLK
jgi:hypothetical protein